MTKHQMTDLHKLSVKDKIKVVQALWDDIAKEQSIDNIPIEHKRILDQRMKKLETGSEQFKPWSKMLDKYQKLV